MFIKDFGFAGQTLTLAKADALFENSGFIRWAWDYDHATYDCKYEHLNDWYYLRIHAQTVQGALESPNAVLKLEDPFMGKATFPHGVDYEADIPEQILKNAKTKLERIAEELAPAES